MSLTMSHQKSEDVASRCLCVAWSDLPSGRGLLQGKHCGGEAWQVGGPSPDTHRDGNVQCNGRPQIHEEGNQGDREDLLTGSCNLADRSRMS